MEIIMEVFILKIIGIFIFFAIISGIYLVKLLNKETLIETFDGIEDIVVKLLAGGVIIYFCFAAVIPAIQDIPNIIHKNIYTIEGVSRSYCSRSKLNSMSAYIFNEEKQEEVHVTFTYEGTIEIGDRLIVQYLPNLKYGVLIEKNGERIRSRIE